MKYTEEDLRLAFRAGNLYGESYNTYFDKPFNEDEYIESLTPKTEETKIPFTYYSLINKLGWEKFCELTGTNEWAKKEGSEFKDSDIYYISKSNTIKYGLL